MVIALIVTFFLHYQRTKAKQMVQLFFGFLHAILYYNTILK